MGFPDNAGGRGGGEFGLVSHPGRVTAMGTSSRAEAGARSRRKGSSAAGQPEGLFLREAGWMKGWSLEAVQGAMGSEWKWALGILVLPAGSWVIPVVSVSCLTEHVCSFIWS